MAMGELLKFLICCISLRLEEFLDASGAFLSPETAAKAVAPGYLSFDEPGPEEMGLFILFRVRE